MRSGITGFILGVFVVVLALIVVRQRAIHDVKPDVFFHFETAVFGGPDFPPGDFETGRLVHRFLFPARFTIKFYNAQYQEVTSADKPGRYGAVVRMSFLGGFEQYRYITLYRAPKKVFWGETPWAASMQLPDVGLDPAVLSNQQAQFGAVLKSAFVDPHNVVSEKLAILLAGLSETSPTDPASDHRTDVIARNNDWWYGLRQRLGLTEKYPHLVELPHDYDADPSKRWPLVLYIIGRGEFGNNLRLARQSALCRKVGDGVQSIPAILVAPQPPFDEEWNPRILSDLLDEMCAKYRVDSNRIYVTGGYGTWDVAIAYPDRFAAILPILCLANPADGPRLKNLPIWAFQATPDTGAFHDAPDHSIPVTMTTAMIDAIRQAGGHPHVTITDGTEDIWEVPYLTDATLTWLFAQKRGQPEVLTPGVPTP